MTRLADLNFNHLIGREVGTAILLKELARGGMAVIFIAYQKTLRRYIAVKILPKSILTPTAADLFQQEAESAAILSHPNVVPIYEFGETEDFLFLTMQLIKGQSLFQHMEMRKRLSTPSERTMPVEESTRIILSVLDGLGYAHSHEIIHRDMKPANVLVEEHTRRPVITDFGIAKITRGSDIEGPKVVGTPAYMSPEQIIGKSVDLRTDIYSTGVILFELTAGALPIPKYDKVEKLMQLKLALKDRLFQRKPSEANPSLDPDMDRIVFKAVSYEPEMRYASCREFMEDLARYRRRSGFRE